VTKALFALLLLLICAPGCGAELSSGITAAELASQMKQAQRSNGFSARMNVAVIQANGRRLQPFKVAVIGQLLDDRQRLLVRGISPESVRNHYYAAERAADGNIRAIAYSEQPATDSTEISSQTRLFDSGMVLWDMLSPWWDWPKQTLGTAGQFIGHGCTTVVSHAPADSPIGKVSSCVERDEKLSLRTQLFDKQNKSSRTLNVERMMKMESGAMAAKKLSITETDNTRTEIEVYSGDENYFINTATFSRLDALLPVTKPR